MTKGVDYAWERPNPSQLYAEGFRFAFRYLSYDNTGKNLTKGEADALHAAGLATVSNWEYATNAARNGYNQGVKDATEGARQHTACGGPDGAPIYFSVDYDAPESDQPAINSYFDGIASVIGWDRTGAYGGYWPIKRLFDAGKIKWGWQTYAWSGGNWDSRAQVRQIQNGVQAAGVDVDINESMTDDIGQWGTDDMAISDSDASKIADAVWNRQIGGSKVPQKAAHYMVSDTYDQAVSGASSYDGRTYGPISETLSLVQQMAANGGMTDAQVDALAKQIADALIASNANGLTEADHAAIQEDVKAALRDGTATS